MLLRLGAGCAAVILAGCAGTQPVPLAPGQTCFSVAAELNRLDREGAPKLATRQNFGGELTPKEKAKADHYNRVLQSYIRARCSYTTLIPSGT